MKVEDGGVYHKRSSGINGVGEDGRVLDTSADFARRFDGAVVKAAWNGVLIEDGLIDGTGRCKVHDGAAGNAGKRPVLCAGVFLAWRIDRAVVIAS